MNYKLQILLKAVDWLTCQLLNKNTFRSLNQCDTFIPAEAGRHKSL